MINDIIVGFSAQDKVKIEKHLTKLLPHLDQQNVILVGGIPIRYHLINSGVDYPIRPCNDIDLLISAPDDLKTSVTNDFLVSHYHIASNSRQDHDFYFALIDEETFTKVDVFSYKPFFPQGPIQIDFQGYKIKMTNPEGQLVVKVLETSRILKGQQVTHNWLEDITRLNKIANKDLLEDYWNATDFEKIADTCEEAIKKIIAHVEHNPDVILHKKVRKPAKCKVCLDTKEFPIISVEKQKELLKKLY